jgi:hypothetical protein
MRGGYLASEELFDRLQAFHQANLLVPVVGDFAGDQALSSTAAYLDELGAGISVVYTSNVEYYLFGTPDWDPWVANVGRFAFTEDAAFIPY